MSINYKNNGSLIPFIELKNDNHLVYDISEGNSYLYSILNFCVDNDIPTVACCAGHKSRDLPYITFIYNKRTKCIINGFLNKISSMKDVEVMFSSSGKKYNDFSVTVYTKMYNRDLIFSMIADCLRSGIKDEHLNDDLNVCLNFAVDINYNLEFSFVSHYNIYIFNRFLRSKYMVGVYAKSIGKSILSVLDYTTDKKTNVYGKDYYLYRTKKKFMIANEAFERICPFFWVGNKCLQFGIPSNDDVNTKVDNLHNLCEQLQNTGLRKRQG